MDEKKDVSNETLEFYLLAIASFVESASPAYAEPLHIVFGEDPQFCSWLDKVWLPKKMTHGKQLRTLVKKRWPDLDWEEAYLSYFRRVTAEMYQSRFPQTPADIALAHCIAERKRAMLAATLASVHPLCTQATLLQSVNAEALRSCTAFRNTHERFEDWQQLGMVGRRGLRLYPRTQAGMADIQRAFAAIQECWYGPQKQLLGNYQQFRDQVEHVFRAQWPIQESRRFMFAPYARPSAVGYEAGDIRASQVLTPGDAAHIAA